ncbi:MAG TPA: NAD(P)-binding domain-containing protein, partial [Micromonospora sp.]
MRIAVLGTGRVGRELAVRLHELGHEVTMGTRDVAATRERQDPGNDGVVYSVWAAGHPGIALADYAEATAGAELVVNATSGAASLPALTTAGAENLAGKILIDIANPLDFSKGMPPTLSVCNDDSLG